jgi:hypothetical protein
MMGFLRHMQTKIFITLNMKKGEKKILSSPNIFTW